MNFESEPSKFGYIFWEFLKLKLLKMKAVLLISYSAKIYFRKIKWNLVLKIESELWKWQIFDHFDSKSLRRYQKILWICSLRCKNLLNFTWHTIEFHYCHHTSNQISKVAILYQFLTVFWYPTNFPIFYLFP